MFEKEAEELVKNLDDCHTKEMIRDAFKEGAEFGYNKGFKEGLKQKVNITTISDCPIKDEWHYVKDGDYPKDNKPVLCILGDINSDNCEVGYYNDVGSGEPWHFETYHLPDDDGDNAWGVSAWKEIVLPKESK